VTATVRSTPLIVSSILSKKIAGGAETVVLDVKCGSGAFMRNLHEAEELATWLVQIGTKCGLKVKTAITDMDQPLGSAVGNALEVMEALDVLTNDLGALPPPTVRFRELCVDLAGEVLAFTGLAPSESEGRNRAASALSSGEARAKAEQWIAAQGGPETLRATRASLPTSNAHGKSLALDSGWVQRISADLVGEAVVDLGGGRHKKGDLIDPAVGVVMGVSVGDRVERGDHLFEVHARSLDQAKVAMDRIRSAFTFSDTPVEPRPLILRKL